MSKKQPGRAVFKVQYIDNKGFSDKEVRNCFSSGYKRLDEIAFVGGKAFKVIK